MDVTAGARPLVQLDQVSLYLPYVGGRAMSTQRTAAVGGTIWRSGRKSHVEALRQIDLELRDGDRLALLGHNGAGKTTLLRIMSGILQPSVGVCRINGSVSAMLSSTIGMDARETGRNNVATVCVLLGIPRRRIPEVIESVIDFSELGDFIDLPVRTYSAGMRSRLGFAIVTSMQPEILVIDEVLSAGDMNFALKARDRVLSLISRTRTLVVASHSADLMRLFCNRALWLDHGRVHMDGPFEEVWQAYYDAIKAGHKKGSSHAEDGE